MAKFSSKDKIQAVKRYLEGTEGGDTPAPTKPIVSGGVSID